MQPPDTGQPPKAKVVPHLLSANGHDRIDDYFWLNERDDPEVLEYLAAENAYCEQMMEPTASLQSTLFDEIKARIKQDDSTVPYRLDDYLYYTRYEDGAEYGIHCRKKGTVEAAEKVLLDGNERALGHEYYAVRGLAISRNQNILAFAEDRVGRRIYEIRFKDLSTGELFDDRIEGVTGNTTWANDDETLFYARQDPVTLRSSQIWRHRLGTDPADDVLVFEEDDDTFSVSVRKTKTRRYLLISSFHTLRSEVRFIHADRPHDEPKLIEPRSDDHEYHVDHFADWFYIRTNDDAENFRLMRAPIEDCARANWEEVTPHREDVLLEDFDVFQNHLVLTERKGGLVRLRVLRWDGSDEHLVQFDEPAYAAGVGVNAQLDSATLRFVYSSMTTPRTVYDYEMDSKERTLLKRDEVLGGFESTDYCTERLMAPTKDGVLVPISLVYREGMDRDGGRPLFLYAYGSYGITVDPSFSAARISLLDRGFTFAIAHVRGGEDLGRRWYEGGKLLHKKNTFTDFIACGEHLVREGYTSPERLYAGGGSAGGLLVGAVLNMRPDLFFGAVAEVPFVDVLTTMLDSSIPLTTGEYDEWGDPREPEFYEYILSYSPYDNVREQEYPHLLVTTGLHDSQVQYWEPAKWIAKLRVKAKPGNRLLLKTNLGAGHGGASGRYGRYKETALNYAFLLELAGSTR